MTNMSVLTRTDTARPSGLVSVDGRAYPLKSAKIAARAEGGIASTTLAQSYDNPHKEPLEVLYTLPLPAGGAVTGYTIRLGKRIIRGEIRRRREAREEYRKALVEGRTVSLLEQDRADTFTQMLGCLPPGETAEVEIEVLQPLAFLPAATDGVAEWEYRFPTVAGVRYQGGEGRVPDAEKLDIDRAAGEGIPVRLEATLVVADGPLAQVNPHAPGVGIVLKDCDGAARVTLGEKMRLDRDLVIRWSAVSREVGVRVVEGKGLPCDKGRYALITLTPPASVEEGLARDLTILIDASGSMSGKPLGRAKIVAEELLRSLDPADRFEILAFATDVKTLVRGPAEASERNIREALTALGRLQASGSTEMTRAIVEALKPLRRDSQRQVIILTDGYIGFEGEVIGEILRRLSPGARLHAVGIGFAVNRTLTGGAARAGRGIEIMVGDDDDAHAASGRLLQATVRPVLTEIQVSGTALVKVAPERSQDVLAGQPLVLLVELSGRGGELHICGRQAGAKKDWESLITIPPAAESGLEPTGLPQTPLPLGALFGRHAVEDLELELAAAGRGSHAEIEAKIESLGLRHGIVTRATSLIAISEDPTVDPKDPRRHERLAVELPADVSAEGLGLGPAAESRVFKKLAILGEPPMPRMDVAGEWERMAASDMTMRPALQKSRLPGLGRLVRRAGSRSLHVRQARVLDVRGRLLILEFEVPESEFLLPRDGTTVSIEIDAGTTARATVIARESSPQGPHEAGLTVRLALRLTDRESWPDGETRIHWESVRKGTGWKKDENVEVDIHITLGEL